MKLIDLLKQELPKWESKYNFAAQDEDGVIEFYKNSPVIDRTGRSWIDKHSGYDWKSWISAETAEDWNTAIVTREQYEAATSLPSVGVVIEVNSQRHGWIEATVTAVTDNWIVAKYSDGAEFAGCHRVLKNGVFVNYHEAFRPIRTEREKGIEAMLDLLNAGTQLSLADAIEQLYDAGYRKV